MLILFKISLCSPLAFLNTNGSAISGIECYLDVYSLGEKHILQLFSTYTSLFSGICWFWPSGHKVVRRKTFSSVQNAVCRARQIYVRWIPKAWNRQRCLCELAVFFNISISFPLLSSLLGEISTDLAVACLEASPSQSDRSASGGLGGLERLWTPHGKGWV